MKTLRSLGRRALYWLADARAFERAGIDAEAAVAEYVISTGGEL
jgi:hypothetical protein